MIPTEPTRQEIVDRAEMVAAVTGWGLAATWGLIHAGDYAGAAARLDALDVLL